MSRLGVIASMAVLAAQGSAAGADEAVRSVAVVAPTTDPAGGATLAEQAPRLRAVVDARAGLGAGDFALRLTDVHPPVDLAASQVVAYADGGVPMSLVILVQGNFRWMGNESYAATASGPGGGDAVAVYQGAHPALGPLIERLAKAGPPGSRAGLLVYTDGKVLVRHELDDPSGLDGGALGSQAEYRGHLARPLLVGLAEATKRLAGERGRRKILVVVGDGQDDRVEIQAELDRAIGELQAAAVECYAIHYSPVVDDDPSGAQHLASLGTSGHFEAATRDSLASLADTIARQIGARYQVDFVGPAGFDGLEHELALVVGGRELPAGTLVLPAWHPVRAERHRVRQAVLAGLALALAASLGLALRAWRRRRPAPAPAPVPRGTVMLGAGGEPEGVPLVGWVVPLGGPARFRTFKLAAGKTRLGSAAGCEVPIDDEFASAEHAEIVSSPAGFVLSDLGSTNGTYLNQARVSSSELVDNDVFRLGQTEFRFKSIN